MFIQDVFFFHDHPYVAVSWPHLVVTPFKLLVDISQTQDQHLGRCFTCSAVLWSSDRSIHDQQRIMAKRVLGSHRLLRFLLAPRRQPLGRDNIQP